MGARRAGGRVGRHARRARAHGTRARARWRRAEGDAAAVPLRRGRPARVGHAVLAVDPSRRLDRADAFPAGPSQRARPRQRDGARAGHQRGVLAHAGARAEASVPLSRAGLRPATRDGRDGRCPAPDGTARGARTRAGAGVPVHVRDAGAGVAGIFRDSRHNHEAREGARFVVSLRAIVPSCRDRVRSYSPASNALAAGAAIKSNSGCPSSARVAKVRAVALSPRAAAIAAA